ncbi:MAG TPA: DUF456 domain-containing protein [Thermoanaerobaculia bacterium]|nr:DUF456 domain-containing protein [Thermoanaerobaculia bacterium]
MITLLWAVAILFVVAGLAGTILPALPGAPLVFVGLLIAAWIDHFQKVGWFTLTLIFLLMVLTFVIEIAAAGMGAKRVGASKMAIFGAAVGTIVGIFFSIPGLLLGPFVGAVLGEYLSRRNWEQAGKVGIGTWIGLIVGTAGKLAVIFTMVGLFVTAYLI